MSGGLIAPSAGGLIAPASGSLLQTVDDSPRAERVLIPGSIPNSPDFKPTNTLFVGVRGEGKTLAMVFFEQVHAPSFHALGWRIQSNFEIEGADFVHPFLGSVISANPLRAYQSQLEVDEITELIPSRRTMSNVSMDWFTVMRQIRKLMCEVNASTQFPWDIDKQMLRQVEVLAICRGYFPAARWSSPAAAFSCFIDVYLFDLHGNLHVGAQPMKVYPPPLQLAFKSFRLKWLTYIWHRYKTNARVASDHASEEVKARLVAQEWDVAKLETQMESMSDNEKDWNEAVNARFSEGRATLQPPNLRKSTPLGKRPKPGRFG